MHTYRMYIKTNDTCYTMMIVEANNFHEAINMGEAASEDNSQIVSVARFKQDDGLIDDPFLAGLLLEEVMNSLSHLSNTGYDTSFIATLLAQLNYSVPEIH